MARKHAAAISSSRSNSRHIEHPGLCQDVIAHPGMKRPSGNQIHPATEQHIQFVIEVLDTEAQRRIGVVHKPRREPAVEPLDRGTLKT